MATTVAEPDQTDEQLAAVAAGRDTSGAAPRPAHEALEELYRRHAPLLFAFIAARAPAADREDLHQEVWRRVWQHLPQQFHGGKFRAWLHQIARNLLIDRGKKHGAGPLVDEGGVPDCRPGHGEEYLLEQERMDALRRCLEKLSAPAAAVVKARLAGDDYPDACRRLGLKPRQAHKLYHTAKEQLKTCVQRTLR